MRVFVVSICVLIVVGSAARAHAEETTALIPQSYEECGKAGALAHEFSVLRCLYVLEPEPTERFTACLLRAEAYTQ